MSGYSHYLFLYLPSRECGNNIDQYPISNVNININIKHQTSNIHQDQYISESGPKRGQQTQPGTYSTVPGNRQIDNKHKGTTPPQQKEVYTRFHYLIVELQAQRTYFTLFQHDPRGGQYPLLSHCALLHLNSSRFGFLASLPNGQGPRCGTVTKVKYSTVLGPNTHVFALPSSTARTT